MYMHTECIKEIWLSFLFSFNLRTSQQQAYLSPIPSEIDKGSELCDTLYELKKKKWNENNRSLH